MQATGVGEKLGTARISQRAKRWLASLAVVSIVAGTFVVVGAQQSQASVPMPTVEAQVNNLPYIAGEDVSVDITTTSASAGDQYNLSFGIVLPSDVHVVSLGTLGAAQVFNAGDVISGAYTSTPGFDCDAVGLTPAQSQPNTCEVPAGKQYLVIQNTSDLPDDADTTHTLTLRPKADTFPVGSTELDLTIAGYTSNDENLIPVFPGTTSVATGPGHTSAPGVTDLNIPVNALRVVKTEPSPEDELLRGVHENTTTYTIRVYHTGEGDISDAKVVDYIPAGLEYLGLGGFDNTTNANGNRGGEESSLEYDGTERLSETPAPAGSDGNSADNKAWPVIGGVSGETVETVLASVGDDGEMVDGSGSVYTKVTWDMETLLANSDDRDMVAGVKQNFKDGAGKAGYFELHYRAAVPLFENTMEFGYEAATDGAQAANLDNNRGASTRHGDIAGPPHGDGAAKSYVNRAYASGTYGTETVSAFDTEHIDAVDVRVLKSVEVVGAESSNEFVQGKHARYTLDIATSEYAYVEMPTVGGASGSYQRPYRLVDDLGDGICPVFPISTPITEGASTNSGVPNLIEGNPNPGGTVENENMTAEAWKAMLESHGVDADNCGFPSQGADTSADALSGATLTGIGFDPETGHFFLDLALNADGVTELGSSNGQHEVSYSTLLKSGYSAKEGVSGATSSGDSVLNTVEIFAKTYSIDELDGLKSAEGTEAWGEYDAWDDSQATLEAKFTNIEKTVLVREAGVPTAAEFRNGTDGTTGDDWVKKAETPFAIGDEVWYRIKLTPPTGTDVRNPKFTDFLPAGMTFDEADQASNLVVKPSSFTGIGTCQPADEVAWLEEFIPPVGVEGQALVWELGSTGCVAGNTDDRFMPLNNSLEIYVKVTVTDQAAFDEVDLPQNLAKYQQNNVDGKIFFLRDEAETVAAQSVRLLKGIESIQRGTGSIEGPNAFNTDVDAKEVVQGDEVTFRVDVTAPEVDTNGYVIWDALPEGIKKADLKGIQHDGTFTATAATVLGSPSEETEVDTGWQAVAYDAGDTGYPADLNSEYDGRTIVVWTFDDTVNVPASIPATDDSEKVEQGLTLGYTVVVPDGTNTGGGAAALLTQKYENTASIVSFANQSNGGSNVTLVPGGENALSTTPADTDSGEYEIPDADTVDKSDVFLPNAKMTKTLVATEIGPNTAPNPPAGQNNLDQNNPDNVIVQGEYATFDISVTIPANTTVRDGVLADTGLLTRVSGGNMDRNPADYQLAGAEVTEANGQTVVERPSGVTHDENNFVLNTETGELFFPEFYTVGDTDETFTVQLKLWMKDVDYTNPRQADDSDEVRKDRPQIGDNTGLRNTATFDSNNVAGAANPQLNDTANVIYREPSPTLQKEVVGEAGGADGNVRFRLAAGNSYNRPALYDAVVYDCLPAGFSIPEPGFGASKGVASIIDGGCTTTGSGSETQVTAGGGSGTLIEWKVGTLEDHTVERLEFTAKIDAAAGGGAIYTNRAQLIGYTLPAGTEGLPGAEVRRGDRAVGVERPVSISNATVKKSVTTVNGEGSAPIGEVVRYAVTAEFPANANFYDVRLTDTLPAGVQYIGEQTVTYTGWDTNPTVSTPAPGAGPNLDWAIEPEDVTLHTQPRSITIEFDALITDDVTASAPRNTASLSWNSENDKEDTRKPAPDATVDVTILHPVVDIEKKVDTAAPVAQDSITVNPDQSFDYELRVFQTAAGNTPAYNVTVVDTVPAGVKIDTSTITPAGADIAGDIAAGEGGTITWTLAGPLGTDDEIFLKYSGEFADSTQLNDQAYENVVNVTQYESIGADGREYKPGNGGLGPVTDSADVTPLFPMVNAAKAVAEPAGEDDDGNNYGIAYVGQSFGWKLTITNSGAGVANAVDVIDTLPEGWEYVPGTTRINGVELLGNPTEGTTANTLTWTAAQLSSVLPLAAGDSFEITFDAKPTLGAIGNTDNPNTGLEIGVNPHTNSVAVGNVTDAQGNTENADGEYIGDGDTADAYIAEADLKLEKAAIGGTEAEIELSNGATLPEGSWIAGAQADQTIDGTVVYEQPQWQLTVTNHGPDAADGPFTVTEEQTLPAGVTVTGWKAEYFAAGSTTGEEIPVTVNGSGENLTLTVGDANTSLNAEGTDRIVITANVNVPAGTTATEAELKNVATVEGLTFEREANKPANGTNPNPNTDEAGKALDSVADLEIVKEFTGDTANLNAGDIVNWTLTVTNHGPDHSRSTNGVGNQIVVVDEVPEGIIDSTLIADTMPTGWTVTKIGNTFTITLDPVAQLNSGASASFTFTGRIGGDVAAGTEITNTATVTPGATPDPDESNNTDDDKVGPETSHTTIAASKQRIVYDEVTETWLPVSADAEVTAGDHVTYRLQLTNTGSHVAARGVTLTDTLPDYLVLSDWVVETPSEGWNVDANGQTLTFTNSGAVLAPGESASVKLTAVVAADHRDAVENTVCVDAGNLSPNQIESALCATDSTAFDKVVDWQLEKSHVTPAADTSVIAGETVRYRLVLSNNGPSVSDGPITVTDVLPAGLSFAGNVAATGATLSDAAVDGQQVSWTATAPTGGFAVGAGVVTIEFDALVSEVTAPGAYENTAKVDGAADEPDSNPTNNDDTDEVTVIRDAQLQIDKQVQSIDGAWGETAEHAAGTEVTWRVKITNSGSSAVPATFTDDLTFAPGVTLVSVDGGSDWEWNEDTQQLEYVANGGLFPVTAADESNAGWITITTTLAANVAPTELPDNPALVNWGKVQWIDDTHNPDLPDGGNSSSDDASVSVVRNADLGIVKQVLSQPESDEWIDADSAEAAGNVTAGESTSYRVVVTNEGPSDAVAPLVVIDALPEGATFEGLNASPEWSASYDPESNTVTFTRDAKYGGLVVGGTPLVIEYGVAFDSALETGSVLANTAEFDEDTITVNGDQNPDNNSNPAHVVVERQIDLGIVKSHDADAVRIGDELPFTVDVTNHGPSEASSIVVTDTVPAGLDVVSEVGAILDENEEPTGWTIESVTANEEDGTTVVIASYASPLAPGAQATPLVINTIITPVAYETVTNVVDVEAAEPEPADDTENPNRDEDTVVVPPQVTLAVEKNAIGEFKVGEVGTYEIVVSNDGPTLDPGPITVTDELPKGLSFNAAPELPTGVTVDHSRGVVTWTLTEPLGVGERVVLTLQVNVHKSAYEQPNHEITNTVVIDSESELTPDSVLTDDATVEVTPADPLVLTGGDLATGLLVAIALMLVLGGAAYSLGRRRQGAANAE